MSRRPAALGEPKREELKLFPPREGNEERGVVKTVGEVGIGFVNHDASEDAKARVPKDVSDHKEVAVKKVKSAAHDVVAVDAFARK